MVWRAGAPVADGLDDGPGFSLDRLDQLLADPQVLVWVDVVGAGHEQFGTLAHEVGLDPHAVEDAVTVGERPKATRHAGHSFVTVYATDLVNAEGPAYASRLSLHRLSAFVLPNALITVRPDDTFDMRGVVDRWEDNADLIRQLGARGVGVLLHGLLDAVVDGHFETIQALDDAVEDLEDLLFDESVQTRAVQRHVYRLRKELVGLRRVVLPMREVVNAVLRHRAELDVNGALDGYYDDLYDHVLRASEWTESLRDMITTLFETNLSLQDAHLNTVMKKLAGWAAIIAVPTAVTGWFGQNVPYPGFQDGSGLWQSVVLILACSTALYLLFRSRDWI